MTPNKARKICSVLLPIMLLLAMVGRAWESVILMSLCTGCFVAAVVLMLLYWRCPHCDRSLGRLSDLKYCPYCGKSLDDEKG